MPPAAIRDLRDLLYWQYAKIIADSARVGKRNHGFVMERFVKLRSCGIALDSIREYVKERDEVHRWLCRGVSSRGEATQTAAAHTKHAHGMPWSRTPPRRSPP